MHFWSLSYSRYVLSFSSTQLCFCLNLCYFLIFQCKNVISKLQRRISKDGYQIVPVLYDLWKRNETSSMASPSVATINPLDLRRIDRCLDNLDYTGVTDFISDVQLMLKNVVQYCKYSYEVCHFLTYLTTCLTILMKFFKVRLKFTRPPILSTQVIISQFWKSSIWPSKLCCHYHIYFLC